MILLFGVTTQTLSPLELGATLVRLMTSHAVLVTRLIMQCWLPSALVTTCTRRRALRSQFFALGRVRAMAGGAARGERVVRIL